MNDPENIEMLNELKVFIFHVIIFLILPTVFVFISIVRKFMQLKIMV
jgi:hypothetical protein